MLGRNKGVMNMHTEGMSYQDVLKVVHEIMAAENKAAKLERQRKEVASFLRPLRFIAFSFPTFPITYVVLKILNLV